MSTPSDNGSWTPQGGDDAHQAAQAGQGVPAQDPWAQPQDGQQGHQQYGQQNPYGAPDGEQGYQQYGQQNPYGAPQAEQPAAQQPYGPASGASASDPYGQASGAGQQNCTPAGGAVPPGSDPYGQPGGAAYGQQGGQQAPTGAAPDPQAQSRLVVGLLGIFLGAFGVHRFLLGYTTIGIIQVAVTVLSCFLLYPIVQIWGLVEGIMVLAKSPTFERDAHGRPLTD